MRLSEFGVSPQSVRSFYVDRLSVDAGFLTPVVVRFATRF